MLDMTMEQEKTINRQKHTAVYEKVSESVDVSTGEILSQTTESVIKSASEPDYIKLYYKTMLAFNGVDDIPLDFVMALSSFVSWSNDGSPMMLTNSKLVRETVAKKCGIKDSMYTKYLKRCTERGLLIPNKGYRGSYYVNPFFIAKGKWDSIRALRAQFDFIAGTWSKVEEVADE